MYYSLYKTTGGKTGFEMTEWPHTHALHVQDHGSITGTTCTSGCDPGGR